MRERERGKEREGEGERGGGGERERERERGKARKRREYTQKHTHADLENTYIEHSTYNIYMYIGRLYARYTSVIESITQTFNV